MTEGRARTERETARIVRSLARYLELNDVTGFERELRITVTPTVLLGIREQKVLTRGDADTRLKASRIFTAAAGEHLEATAAEEFGRYASFSLVMSSLREALKIEIKRLSGTMPKLSLRQLLQLAARGFERLIDRPSVDLPARDPEQSVAENERRVHEMVGYGNDALFAMLRAINETAPWHGTRDLQRPDAMVKAGGPFDGIITLSSMLVSLDYMFDCASYGEFYVSSLDRDRQQFRLDIRDRRLSLIRQLNIRRRLVLLMMGKRNPRFVRDKLTAIQDAAFGNAIESYIARTAGLPPAEEDVEKALAASETMLMQVDAEDDLLFVAAPGDLRAPMLYTLSMLLRWSSLAKDIVCAQLPGKARRGFASDIRLDDLLAGFARAEEQEAARGAWLELTAELPVRSHFDLVRRPFLRTGAGSALPIPHACLGIWTPVVRELVNSGGETGRKFGEIWEDFVMRGFVESGWDIVGRNIHITEGGATLTEVDLLLRRAELLLVVEIKALTGSGVSPYDHWKNRSIIEKGCRQARTAAEYMRAHPEFLVSLANRKVANEVKHIQPLVLTSEGMFDGWSYVGVPVAAETVRKAITEGTKVDYFDAASRELVRTVEYLKKEDLTTATILAALQSPIELKLSPEQGAVDHVPTQIGDWLFHVPRLSVGPGEDSDLVPDATD